MKRFHKLKNKRDCDYSLNDKTQVLKYVNRNLIFINKEMRTTDELFAFVAEKAKKAGYVNKNFLNKIKEREKKFPTGLQLEHQGVAIPHTDADTINKEFISIITNSHTEFKCMDDPSKSITANAIFVLGLNKPHQQLSMLQSLMKLFQDNDFLNRIEAADSVDKVIEEFHN